MSWCVMCKCKISKKTNSEEDGLTYHRFPADELMRIQWTNIVRQRRKQDDWVPSPLSVICSKHFDDDQKYTTRTGRLFLKLTAVPSIVTTKKKLLRNGSRNNLENVDISDKAGISQSPEVCALEEQVKQLRNKIRILKKKNRNLKRQNARLKLISKTRSNGEQGINSEDESDTNKFNY